MHSFWSPLFHWFIFFFRSQLFWIRLGRTLAKRTYPNFSSMPNAELAGDLSVLNVVNASHCNNFLLHWINLLLLKNCLPKIWIVALPTKALKIQIRIATKLVVLCRRFYQYTPFVVPLFALFNLCVRLRERERLLLWFFFVCLAIDHVLENKKNLIFSFNYM